MKQSFEILEHPSDLGIQAYGNSMQELFRNAMQGLISIIAGASRIESRLERKVTIKSLDRENLMVRWLTEILYLYDAEKFLTADIRFETLTNNLLQAKLFGELYNASNHELKLDVKAITYHQLKIENHDGDWIARIFVDI